jgi:peptidoglycan hydrolase-like protein with peptidoglycan-binding domain
MVSSLDGSGIDGVRELKVLRSKTASAFAGKFARASAILVAVVIVAFAALPAEAKKLTADSNDAAIPDIPNGEPMTLIVSLGSQKVDVYRGTTLITTSQVSTGMPGHATKAGVFSILEKQRYHHSNIYSGAPMPFMNRITWSGTALHAGVVPGYPASHGCIRLPFAFAPKLFQITTVGEHVVVARDRPAPTLIEHPALFQPLPPLASPVMAKEPAPEQHTEIDETAGSRLAAGLASPVILAKAEMQDTATDEGPQQAETAAPVVARHANTDATSDPERVHAITPVPITESRRHALAEPEPGGADDHATLGVRPVIDVPAQPNPPSVPAAMPAPPALPEATQAGPTTDTSQSTPALTTASPPTTASPSTVVSTPAPIAASPAAAALPTTTTASPTAAEAKIDSGTTAAAVQAAEPRSNAPLRVLVTRRTERDRVVGVQQLLASMGYLEAQNFDGTVGRPTVTAIKAFQKANGMPETGAFTDALVKKIYEVAGKGEPPVGHLFVRQEFGRVFDAPVSFKNPEEPLGTHVYTAMKFAPGDTSTKWMVVTVDESATNPLDRIEIPDDIRQKISERLTPGSSLIIADTSINTAGLPKGADFLVWAGNGSAKVTSASAETTPDEPKVQNRYRNTARRYYQYQNPYQQRWFARPW